LASVFLNAPFWGQNDAFKAQNDPFLKLFWYDYSVLAWFNPKDKTTTLTIIPTVKVGVKRAHFNG
jgi:hypothetical protein